MAEQSIAEIASDVSSRGRGLREEDLARADPHVREALTENKRSGLLLAVRARWVALGITAVLIFFLNEGLDILYYWGGLVLFALIGWAQLRAGKVAQSGRELLLILADILLATFLFLIPSPFSKETWPTAFQYQLIDFSYFFVLLAAAALAYSWRTVVAFGTWTTAIWLIGLLAVVLFGREIPELSERAASAFAGHGAILREADPNNPRTLERIQEVVIFLIVAGILAVNGRRNTQLLFRQADVARERANLARYFPPSIVEEMAERDQPLGEVRSAHVATMFVDIVGFTPLAERLSPDETVALLREYHGRLANAVFAHQGTLDKFLGDGLMATFGTPEPGPDDATNAIRCARAILQDMAAWNAQRETTGDPTVRVSIGLHFGLVVLGDIGSEHRLEYAVLGDTVNVASRLENLTRELGVRMVVSDALVAAARDGTEGNTALDGLTESGARQLRGRNEPITVWTF